jgi:hypothetical protein
MKLSHNFNLFNCKSFYNFLIKNSYLFKNKILLISFENWIILFIHISFILTRKPLVMLIYKFLYSQRNDFLFIFFIIIYGFFTNHAEKIDLKFRYFVDPIFPIFPIFQCFPCWSRIKKNILLNHFSPASISILFNFG